MSSQTASGTAVATNLIEMRIAVPKYFIHMTTQTIMFSPDDFNLSWTEFLQKHKRRAVLEFIQSCNAEFVVHDIRREHDRKTWLMSSPIKDYINSFKKTMQIYRAIIAQRTTVMVISEPVIPPPKLANGGSSRPLRPVPVTPPKRKPNVTGPSAEVNNSRTFTNAGRSEPIASTSTSPSPFKRPAPPGENPPKGKQRRVAPPAPPFSFMNYDLDDVVSMANSVDSQDSQMEDLVRQGVRVEEIKPQIVQNIVKHVDNTAMLRIRKELQDIIDSGRWLKLTSRLPVTAGALQLIFGLSPSNSRR